MRKIINFVNSIINIISSNDKKLMLGRWSINYCINNINKKIDSGNEDHCGPCGQYDLKKDNTNNIKIKESELTNKLS
jgi:hypothetical protein